MLPSDWEVSAIRMSNQEVVLGIQDLEKARLEIRWQEAGWKKAKDEARKTGRPLTKRLLEPEEVAENYHKQLKKKAKGMDFEEGVAEEKVDGHQAYVSKWYDETGKGYEAIWYCGVSDRYYYLRYADGEDYSAFKSLLATVTCHTSLNTLKWQYLGLNLELPRDYALDSQKAEVGKLTLVFLGHWPLPNRKKSSLSWLRPPPLPQVRKLILSRWNAIRFGNAQLDSWTKDESEKLIKKYIGSTRVEMGPMGLEVNGHAGKFVLFSIGGGLLRKPSAYLASYGWFCDASNSAFLLVTPLPMGVNWKEKIRLENAPPSPPEYVKCH